MDQVHMYEMVKIHQHELIADGQSCAAAHATRRDRRRARRAARAALDVTSIVPATAADVIAIPRRFDDAA